MGILEDILNVKRLEVERLRRQWDLSRLREAVTQMPPPRSLRSALKSERLAVIAELKRASPSQGILIDEYDPVALAREYESAGVHAISVLTDERFFGGSPAHLRAVREAVQVPVLRKDFILDEFQVFESRLLGADAVLLIVRAVPVESLRSLYLLVRSLGMDALVEVHARDEIAIAQSIGAEIIGVNNRDLSTFDTTIAVSLELRPFIRDGVATVSESGIRTKEDAALLKRAGYNAILVGESLIVEREKNARLKEMLET